jgi:hypothetical protein
MAGAFRLKLRCRTRLLLLAAGCTLGSVPVLAGEWEQSISLPATIEHDTNLPLATTNKQGVSRLIVVPAYSLVGTYGLDELKAGLGLRVERSSDQRISIDREDPNLLFGWRRQTETGEFGLTATYQEVSSRAAELENTGGIAPDSTQKTGSLKGLWRSAVTERSTLSTDADYKMVSYDGGTQTDYKNLVAGISWNYTWSERIEPFLRFSASHYEPDKTTVSVAKSDYYAATVGVKVKASEHLEWTAQGGPGRVSARTTDTGWQGSFDMKYRGDRYDVGFSMGRSVTTSGDGGFVASDRVASTFGYIIDERSSLGLFASWQDNKGDNPNTMQQLGASVSHELSQFWHARLYYQHKLRRQDGQSDASGDVLGVTLVYSPQSF